jgi:hypothetical protein
VSADEQPEFELPGLEDIGEPPDWEDFEPDPAFAVPKPNRDETAKERLNRDQEEIKSIKADREMKKAFADRVYWLIVGWLAAVVAMLVLSSLDLLRMTERLLLTIIAATAVKVLGLLLVVVRHLFPLPPKQ